MSEYENEAPTGDVQDPEYVSRTGQSHIPVAKDDASIEDPINAETADSDKQLERDDADAIDQSNIVDGRTRGAKPSGGYREPGDSEGLPDDTGVSQGAAT
ncbi:hypothetical protein MMC10_003894 [Thelotrema lepadinum]|nr:hypothetical protein [Thelotrema lepadinum]